MKKTASNPKKKPTKSIKINDKPMDYTKFIKDRKKKGK